MLRKSDNITEERQHIMAEEMFVKIRESLRDSPYKHHVVPTCFMLDWRDTEMLEEQMERLRETMRMLAVNQPQMPVEVPLRWLAFEREMANLLKKDVYMANYCQLYEIAQRQGIGKDDEFWAMLDFLHDQGKLLSFPCNLVDRTRDKWEGIAVLSPQWFINHIYKVFNPSLISTKIEQPKENQSECTSATSGYLTDEYFNSIWSDVADCKQTFIGILENLDLLCEPGKEEKQDPDSVDKKLDNIYWIPWVARKQRPHTTTLTDESCCLRLYIDFHDLLPVGLFSRLVARLGNWACRQEWRKLPQLSADQGRIAVHPGHDLLIEKTLFAHAQIMITVMRVFKADHPDWSNRPPSVQVCEKVRHLLEAELEKLRNSWYKRLYFCLCVSCPCKKTCVQHGIPGCGGRSCLHLLPLNDCLAQKTVQCEYRVVKTDFIRKLFPFSSLNDCEASSYTDLRHLPFKNDTTKYCWDHYKKEQSWIKVASSLLNDVNAGNDWLSLAKRLGYSERVTTRFQDEANPSQAMIEDWLKINGRTRYCVDLLVSCLSQIGREDISEKILANLEPENPCPSVFISYQWDAQELVIELRRRLELAGYPCWMDVGQLGGGDSLYGKIYEGISGAKVVLCCLTPRYVTSLTCSREISLADVLRKPVIPVMVEPTPWPPPGPLAIVLSSLVYIDMCGVGGHGGSGKQADWEQRFNEIVDKVFPYLASEMTQRAPHTQVKPYTPSRAILISWDEYVNESDGIISAFLISKSNLYKLRVGGHGGSGKQADWEQRFNEIVDKVFPYLASEMTQRAPHTQVKPYTPSRAVLVEDYWSGFVTAEVGPTSSQE
ncbi:uncharacterized protein LOC106459406, partial [Limulus polyphemus]|uniref:Uncharacterized protein LOC106459406 n=1 Tax=Limulus polyphemus TaxID=6850 RepID=A0ABM1SDB5_LIMPO